METEDESLSQNSQMETDDLDEMDQAALPKNTDRSTDYAMKKFKAWLRKRQISIDMSDASPEELAPVLRQYYGELKTVEGKPPAPATMNCLKAGIQRHLNKVRQENPVNISKDTAFTKANGTFKAKCKLYAAMGNAKAKRKEEIAPGDLQKIRDFIADDRTAKDPRRLSQAVWFLIAFNLGCRGRELYRQLRQDSLLFATDDVGKEYMTIEQTVVEKNHQGGPSKEDQVNRSTRIYDCEVGPYTLIGLIKLYLSKLHPDCIWLFQQCRTKTDDGPWYKNEPLGVNSLGAMMKTISKSAALSQTYTNHCVRSTTITVLFNAGIEVQHIQSRTGHRSLQGLQPYIGNPTVGKKRDEAHILQEAMGCASGDRSSSRPAELSQTLQLSQSTRPSNPQGVGELVSGQFSNCVFNITVNR